MHVENGNGRAHRLGCTYIGLAEIQALGGLLAAAGKLLAEVDVGLDGTRLLGRRGLGLVGLGHLDGDHLGPVGVGGRQRAR